jgi:glycosyltransferase involved in cell wall biosynthesis
MKILMTADPDGEDWTYALELSGALCRKGDAVFLASLGRASAEQRCEAAGIQGLTLFENDRSAAGRTADHELERDDAWLFELERELAPDVVHCNTMACDSGSFRAPVVTVVHSCALSRWWALRGRDAPPEWDGHRERVSRCLRAAQVRVAPTRAALRWTESIYGPLDPFRVIFHGRTPALFRQANARSEIRDPFVLAAGPLGDEANGFATLSLAARDLPFPVKVAGTRAGSPGGSEVLAHVEALGLVPPTRLAAEMCRAAIFAHPALYEPFALGVLEAALAGCALVLSDIPSLRELWRGAALFVPPRDPECWRQALALLLERENERRRLGTLARQRALRYTPEPMATRYRQVYREAAERAARSTREPAPERQRLILPPTTLLGVPPAPANKWRWRRASTRARAS